MRVLNVGVVGCGGIANNKHLPAMKRVGKINIVAFCDLIEERAAKAKEDFGTSDARIYTDYQELIKEDLDAVYVLTPNSSHAPIAIAAMKAGKHVMCEKPMAKTKNQSCWFPAYLTWAKLPTLTSNSNTSSNAPSRS